MRSIAILRVLFILILAIPLMGQYWQQWVEYEMDIYLDGEEKTLTVTSDLVYVNNSPDPLDRIYMHLIPNAFNSGTIAEQVWKSYGNSFEADKEWTGISIQRIESDSVELAFDIRDDTILDITLANPLASQDTLTFSMDWVSKVHEHLDRSGWEGKQFDFAQWYPKFVVYDENGWHDDPFGDWGEFYGEFGNFKVHLDLPAEQIVGATGVVIAGDPGWDAVKVDTSQFWDEWVETFRGERGSYLADLDSSDRRKVSFFAENVHDFAWSCSQDFVYEHGEWNGIDIHVLFTSQVGEKWTRDVVLWGERSLAWLSGKFGPYVYPQVTLVKALLGGGMEYPMLVMDGSDSESLAAHEIGHIWFYGIFGNDELDEAWLDEGFTTFQTTWYKEHHYPENDYSLSRNYVTQFEYDNLPLQNYKEAELKPTIRYMLSVANQPIALKSFNFSDYYSYQSNVYDKASVMLGMLKNYLGEERFLAGMKVYYDRWALKHVNEQRFIKSMEEGSGENLDWFFDQWLYSANHVDYDLVSWDVTRDDEGSYQTDIHVENKGGMFVPISATVYGGAGESASEAFENFLFRESGVIEVTSNFKPERVYLDADNVFYDVDRRNNGSQRKRAWRYDYRGWDAYPDDRNLYLWKPLFTYSDAVGPGLGLSVKQVYRNTGNFLRMEVDGYLDSANPDVGLSFSHLQQGVPFQGTWKGYARTWRSIQAVSLNYEIHWAERYWINPLHYLTLRIDVTDATHGIVPTSSRNSFTRLGFQYELQDEVFGGDHGFSTSFYTSPSSLGSYGSAFSQLFLMNNWTKWFSKFKLNNRTNLLLNSADTPDLVKSRPASTDLRSVLLDRRAMSMHDIFDNYLDGYHYYSAGGGRLRGYTDSLDVPVNYIWSNNLDLTFRYVPYLPNALDLGIFIDVGQVSNDAETWDNLGDAGFNIHFKPKWKRTNWISTLIRPFSVKLEVPILRYEDSGWVSTYGATPWVITVSN